MEKLAAPKSLPRPISVQPWNASLQTRTLACFIVFLFPPAVAAQHTPGIEIAIGYSYLRLSTDSGFNPAHLNGWDASVKLDVTPGIQLVAEFGGNYGHRVLAPYTLFLPIPGDPNPLIQTRPGALHQPRSSLGPRFAYCTAAG